MSKDVSTPARNSMVNDETLAKIRTLRGGVSVMRGAGTLYLHKEPRETDKDYANRLSRSWLFPGLGKTVKDFADHIFTKPVVLSEDTPTQFQDYAQNITNEGRNLNTFARDICEDGIEAGIDWILVDCPSKPENMTKAEEEAQNFRPYFAHIKADDVLGFQTETILNETRLSQIRIKEQAEIEDDGSPFEKKQIDQIRVLTRTSLDEGGDGPVSVQIWRKLEGNTPDAGKWFMFEETFTQLPDITIVPFYTNRKGFFKAKPPLEELADLNIAHWQSASDQRNILHTARVPLLHATGYKAEDFTASANNVITNTNEKATLAYVEIQNGSGSIGAGRDDLKDLEEHMQVLGLELMIKRPNNAGATGAALDDAKSKTPLAALSANLQDTLEKAFHFAGKYMDVEFTGSVVVYSDFGAGILTNLSSEQVMKARQTRLISHETFIAEWKRRGLLMESVDVELEAELLESEAANDLTTPSFDQDAD